MTPIIAKEPETVYTPAPEGLHQAICVDVVDLGMVPTQWGDKHKVQIRWLIDEELPPNKVAEDGVANYMVTGRYTLSLHENAQLRKVLTSWRGKAFSTDELAGFDLEKLIGANCQILVTHNRKDDRVFANPETVTPLARGMDKMTIPRNYVRAKDRPDFKAPVYEQEERHPDYPETNHDDETFDDDLPF